MDGAKVLSTVDEVLAAMRNCYPGLNTYKAFYNSRINAIVTDPVLMQVPIDDHLVHRGHALTGSLLVVRGKTFQLSKHIQRLLTLSQRARITLPMSQELLATRLKQVAGFSGLQDCVVKYWLSSGPGTMSICPEAHNSVLYALAISITDPITDLGTRTGHHEVTVSLPIDGNQVPEVKWANPIVDATSNTRARKKGGEHGIEVDSEGYVTSCGSGHVCFLQPGNVFLTPPYDKALTNSLISEVFQYAKSMQEDGFLSNVEERKVTLAEAQASLEVIECMETTLHPVCSWDDHTYTSRYLWSALSTRLANALESSSLLELVNSS